MNQRLILTDCDPKFYETIKGLYDNYKSGLRFNFEINYSGVQGDFQVFYNKVDPKLLNKIAINLANISQSNKDHGVF